MEAKSVANRFIGKSTKDLVERFWSKCMIGDDCWEWQPSPDQRYGKFESTSAHRFAYWIFYGVDPMELWVNHFCDNKRCVRPDHLYLGTPKNNTRDSIEAGTHPSVLESSKTHCKYGHPYNEKNTYVDTQGNRRCRVCRQECKRLHRQRKRDAGLEYR